MRPLLAVCTAAAILCISTASSRADTQLGVQGIILSGRHEESRGTVSGTGGGFFIHIDQRWPAIQLHVEGIPSVATAKVDTSLGSLTATIGMFAATARFRIDPHGRLWAGVGTETLAQQTPIAARNEVNASRLAGTRFELVSRLPVASDRFLEAEIAGMPHLSGVDNETLNFRFGPPITLTGPETASMVDLPTAYGIRHGKTEYLFGVRPINYAAKFAGGREADRNVGAGVTAEIRLGL